MNRNGNSQRNANRRRDSNRDQSKPANFDNNYIPNAGATSSAVLPITTIDKRVGQSASTSFNSVPYQVGTQTTQYYNRGNSIVLSGYEFYSDVRSTGTGFTLIPVSINPGLASVFPWLSNIANAFEYYRFEQLCFEFKSGSASSTAGTIMMAIDMDCYDQFPQAKREMLTFKPSTTIPPWQTACLEMPRELLQTKNNGKLLIRSGSFNGDQNLNDLCNFYLAMQDVAANYVGDIWISYRVRLWGQQQTPIPPTAKFTASAGASVFNNPVTSAGTATFFLINTTSITIAASGCYMLTWRVTGATTLTAMSIAAAGTTASVQVLNATVINGAATAGQVDYEINIGTFDPLAPCVLTFTETAVANGASAVRIAPWNTYLN